jgi:hypothetical protein
MLLRMRLLGLTAGFALTGVAAAAPAVEANPIARHAHRVHKLPGNLPLTAPKGSTPWAPFGVSLETLLEHLTIPLGTATLREGDRVVVW